MQVKHYRVFSVCFCYFPHVYSKSYVQTCGNNMIWQTIICWGEHFSRTGAFVGGYFCEITVKQKDTVDTEVLMFNTLWKRWVNHASELHQRLFSCKTMLSAWSNLAEGLRHASRSVSLWQKAALLGQIKKESSKSCPWLVLIKLEGKLLQSFSPALHYRMEIFTPVSCTVPKIHFSAHFSLPLSV